MTRDPFPRWQLAVTAIAVILRFTYAAAVYLLSQLPWLHNFMGVEMRTDAVINVVAATAMGVGLVFRLHALVLAGAAVGLIAVLQPASGVGWQSAVLLPWVTSLSAVSLLAAAARLRPGISGATAALLVPYSVAVAASKAWGAVDFAVAACTTLLVLSLLGTVWRRGARTPRDRVHSETDSGHPRRRTGPAR